MTTSPSASSTSSGGTNNSSLASSGEEFNVWWDWLKLFLKCIDVSSTAPQSTSSGSDDQASVCNKSKKNRTTMQGIIYQSSGGDKYLNKLHEITMMRL